MTLYARTVALPGAEDVDLLAVAGDGGVLWEHEVGGDPGENGDAHRRIGLAGRGVAARIDLPDGVDGVDGAAGRVAEVLGAIRVDDRVGAPGCGPVAVGALPFDHGAPASLVVPALVVGRRVDGTAWVTTVADSPEGALGPDAARALVGAVPPPPVHPSPDAFSLVASHAHDEWRALVQDAVEEIGAGRFAKVVLAREVMVDANRTLSVSAVVGRLRSLYPSCMTFSIDGFVGASPELLVSRIGDRVRSHPLAGTCPHSGDPYADEQMAARLLASAKDRHEHRLVVDGLAAGLAPLCEELQVPETPSVLPLRNVLHLATRVRGRLRPPEPTALDLAVRLHPTAAVAGTPADDAIAWLTKVEGFDRGRYAGPVGWVDARGDGEWALGIRCADIDGTRARLMAGVGIVAGSVPEDELAETQLKLQALLAAVVRP